MSMTQSRPLAMIMMYLSGLGILLSGYLSYQTLFVTTGCSRALITCGGNPVRFFGVPQCVLGLVMFLAVFIVAAAILTAGNPKRWVGVQFWLALVGTLFAASLSTYELWIRHPAPVTMPACVYGFFLYFGILLAAWLAKEKPA